MSKNEILERMKFYLVSDWKSTEATSRQNFAISDRINDCDTNYKSMLTSTRSLDLTKPTIIKYHNICLKPVKLLFDGICEIFAKIHWMDQQFMLERNMVKHSKKLYIYKRTFLSNIIIPG